MSEVSPGSGQTDQEQFDGVPNPAYLAYQAIDAKLEQAFVAEYLPGADPEFLGHAVEKLNGSFAGALGLPPDLVELKQAPSPAIEGEVLDAGYVEPKHPKITSLIAVFPDDPGDPSADFLEAVAQEATALASQPIKREKRKGNRRPRALRVKKGFHPVANQPAAEDPIIQRRRAMAMPLWNKGLGASAIRDSINDWLVAQGLLPVSAETIRHDKLAIASEWELDYDKSSAINRAQHIAALNRMKMEALESYEHYKGQEKGATAAAGFLKTAAMIESELAVLDGSKKRAEVAAAADAASSEATKITRVYLGVNIQDLEQGNGQVTDTPIPRLPGQHHEA